MRTYNDIYLSARNLLRQSGVEAFSLEAKLLVAGAAGKTTAQLLRGNVPAADLQRVRAYVYRNQPRRRHFVPDGAGDAAAAAAQVKYARVHLPPRQKLLRRVHELLRVHARYQHIRRRDDGQPVKLP